MVSLPAQKILATWEQWGSFSDQSKTLALLGLVSPASSPEALSQLNLGERNHRLLELHKSLIGPTLQAYAECTECGEALDLDFAIDALGFCAIHDIPETHSIVVKELNVQLRLPNGEDLMALATVDNIEQGRLLLFSRCILNLSRNGTVITVSELSDDELDQLEHAIAKLDPRMEILFDLQCPECAHSWQSPLEISTYVWHEYDVYVRQLLENVHVLASHYGWSEEAILAMSQQRRQFYLDRVML